MKKTFILAILLLSTCNFTFAQATSTEVDTSSWKRINNLNLTFKVPSRYKLTNIKDVDKSKFYTTAQLTGGEKKIFISKAYNMECKVSNKQDSNYNIAAKEINDVDGRWSTKRYVITPKNDSKLENKYTELCIETYSIKKPDDKYVYSIYGVNLSEAQKKNLLGIFETLKLLPLETNWEFIKPKFESCSIESIAFYIPEANTKKVLFNFKGGVSTNFMGLSYNSKVDVPEGKTAKQVLEKLISANKKKCGNVKIIQYSSATSTSN